MARVELLLAALLTTTTLSSLGRARSLIAASLPPTEAECPSDLGLGDVCNACPYPVVFRSAYTIAEGDFSPFPETGANCSAILRAFPGTTAHSWLCLTPWQTLAPGEAAHLDMDAPPSDLVIQYNATVHLLWDYTAHVINDDGSAASLTRGVLGSRLQRHLSYAEPGDEPWWNGELGYFDEGDRVPCYPPSAPGCVWWASMPLTERAPPDWEPTGGGSLTLRCPGYAGPAANQTPGPLPSEVLPIVVQNDCAFPIQFSIAFPEDGGQRDYACGPHIWGPPPPAQGDGMCVQGATLIPANQTAVLDATLWGPGRSLPQGLAFSASIPLSEPTHWLSAGLNGSRCVGEDTSNGSDPFFQQEVWAPVPAINATDGTVTMTEDAKLVLSCDPSKVTLRRPDEPPAFPNKPCPL